MREITIVCWVCGASKSIDYPHPISFAFEFQDAATWAGFVTLRGVGRFVAACPGECEARSITKRGTLRRRPRAA